MQFLATMEKLVLRYYNFFLEGVRNTLIIAFFAVLLGTLLGTLMAMARMSRIKPLKWLATAYIEFFRGTPLMVQLMFIFYGLPMIGVTFPSVSFIPDFDRFAAGIVAMSLNSCAYVAEIIRSGIQAVDKGQMEAARSPGLPSRRGHDAGHPAAGGEEYPARAGQRVCDHHQGVLHRVGHRYRRFDVPRQGRYRQDV